MTNYDNIIDLFLENVRKILYPEEWLSLDLKFSKSELFTLLLVDKSKEITMTELAEYINAPMSTATGVADRLVKNKYLRRERSEEDRRIVVLCLSDKGIEFVNDFKKIILKYTSLILDNLTAEERILLEKIILKVINTLEISNDVKPDIIESTNSKLNKITIE